MKILISALAAVSIMALATPAGAHSEGDFFEVPQRKPIGQLAKDAVEKLVAQSKLPASWSNVNADRAKLLTEGDTTKWLVTFENPAAKPAKRTLYVTMSGGGEFVSASFKPV